MKKKLIVVLCFVMAFTMAFAGCGNKEEGGNNEPVVEATSLVVATTADMDTLDFQAAVASDTDRILFNVYEGMLKASVDGNLEYALATKYDFDTTSNAFTFTLREGVKFHDGHVMTADDVVYSFKRLAGMLPDDTSAIKTSWQDAVKAIEKVDDKTVKLTLNTPDASFVANLVQPIYEEGTGKNIIASPNGTGPYKLAKYEAGVGVTLEKYADYWGTPAKIDTVNVKIYSDNAAANLAMANGEIDMIAVTKNNLELVPDTFYTDMVSTNTAMAVHMNREQKPFDDIRVRQALNYATDRQALVDALNPGAEVLDGPVTALQKFWQNPAIKNAYPYDPAKASALLQEAGYSESNPCAFTFTYCTNLDAYCKDCALVLDAQWAKVKEFKVTLEDGDWSTFVSQQYSNPDRTYQAAFFGFTGKMDPNSVFQRWLSDSPKSNVYGLKNEEYDKLILAGRVELDQTARQKIYWDAQKIVSDEACAVWIQDVYSYMALKKGLKGYVSYPVYFWNFALMYWE